MGIGLCLPANIHGVAKCCSRDGVGERTQATHSSLRAWALLHRVPWKLRDQSSMRMISATTGCFPTGWSELPSFNCFSLMGRECGRNLSPQEPWCLGNVPDQMAQAVVIPKPWPWPPPRLPGPGTQLDTPSAGSSLVELWNPSSATPTAGNLSSHYKG